jgi:DHA3 family macrolide efflux protein-like MFS transporter
VTTLIGVVGLGVGVLLIGITPASFFTLALIGLFFGAVMNSMSNAALMALLQQAIAPEMQGRVWALGGSLAGAAMPLGLAIAGPLADMMGVRTLYVVSGILYILLGIGAFFVRAIMHIEDNHRAQAVVEG